MQTPYGPESPKPPSWHALSTEEALVAARTDACAGLSCEEARGRLERFGANELRRPREVPWLAVIAHQFRSPLIYLLLVAAAIALALGHRSDALVIAVVLVVNALIGAFQEGRAERSLEALRKLAKQRARVLRGGEEALIEAREVVPGDILLLEAGDAVAADGRLLHSAALQVAEAALTGESVPVAKDLLPLAADTSLADRRNMVYAGTHVSAGRARALIVASGLATEVGRIAALAEQAVEPKTPLELRIARFGRHVVGAAGALFALIHLVGFLRGLPLGEILMVGISQVVSMVPEGLPVAMTVALAVGVQRMARRQAIVRRLAAVETLGSTTVICSDKTGTLTRNEMTAIAVYLPDGRELEVTGNGYEPVGCLRTGAGEIDPLQDEDLRALLEAAVLCNDAQLQGPAQEEPRWRPLGDPTEVALLALAMKGGVVPLELRSKQPRCAELPFDAGAKLMATQHEGARGPRVVIKGAPEVVLEMCRAARRGGADVPLDAEARQAVSAAAERMAARALRLLAVAVVEGAQLDARDGFAGLRERASLLGVIGQIDPPRPEVKEAIAACRAAGIRPVMVTGDHRGTGQAIARELDIAREGDEVVDGRQLDAMSDAELAGRIERIAVFARVHPAQKLRIVAAYQRQEEVVAMTGDGVNDAPALVQADVGVAMGMTGTEVAKEAAKIVIADDCFATIVAAVEEGRIVYRNLKKLILYLVATSICEVLVLMSALLLGYPPPLLAVQILWINLVTDGALTVTLIMEPAEGDEMRQRPLARSEPIVTAGMLQRMAFMVPAMAASALGWYTYRLSLGLPFDQVQTETFTVLAVCQWFNALNCRSEWRSALSLDLLRNRWLVGGLIAANALHAAVVFFRPLGEIFHTVPFSLTQVVAIGAVASAVLWVEELRKWRVRRRKPRAQAAA